MIGSRRRATSAFPSYLGVSKAELERRIVTRRENINSQKENFSQYTDYVKKEGNVADYQSRWSRPSSAAQKTVSAKTANFIRIKNSVLYRKSQLAQLLRIDAENFQKEIEEKAKAGKSSEIQSIMNRVEEMKSAKEYTRRSEAQGKIMQQWRRDNPKIRNAHTERRRQEMTEIWSGQLEQKEEEQRQKETQREVEKQRLADEAEEIKLMNSLATAKRKRQQEIIRDDLEKQIKEINDKEIEQNKLKNEERELLINQENLLQSEITKKLKDDRKRKEQHRSILYRQYRAQLLRRSHEIEDDLQHDLALLERIKREEIEEAKIKEIKLSEAKIFAQEAIDLLKLKLKEEKQAQQEIEMLYRDQAEKWWEQREKAWNTEKEARKVLLQDVLDERREQLEYKLEQNRENQLEVLSDRENLLRNLEADQLQINEENELTKRKRDNFIVGIKRQLESKDERIRQEIDQEYQENYKIAETQRELEDLEIEEQNEIMTGRPTVRQAWR